MRQIENLVAYEKAAEPEIRILAGGGLDAVKIKAIRAAMNIHESHGGCAAAQTARIPPSLLYHSKVGGNFLTPSKRA